MPTFDLRFDKFQGLGNDFVVVDGSAYELARLPELSRRLCDRHAGIGADGLIVVHPDQTCAARMEFYNPDGSRAQMCGNGIRCVARYLRLAGRDARPAFPIMTDAGARTVRFVPDGVAADLGEPSFAPEAIPVLASPEEVCSVSLALDGLPPLPPAVCLSLGNPHCVLFVEDVAHLRIDAMGPRIERLPIFPERINVEFAEVLEPRRLACRVWERGAGETPACGTGAAAAVIAATVRGLVPGEAAVDLPGGTLAVAWRDRRSVTIAGGAAAVFSGSISIETSFLARSNPGERSSSPAA
jgi:diaminopimelate epimerase